MECSVVLTEHSIHARFQSNLWNLFRNCRLIVTSSRRSIEFRSAADQPTAAAF